VCTNFEDDWSLLEFSIGLDGGNGRLFFLKDLLHLHIKNFPCAFACMGSVSELKWSCGNFLFLLLDTTCPITHKKWCMCFSL